MPNTSDMTVFRERFSAELERYGNVSRLADRAGVHRGTLYDWRNGRQEPSLAAIASVAEELGCTLDYLAGRVAERTSYYTAQPDAVAKALEHSEAVIAALRGAAEAAPVDLHQAAREKLAGDLATEAGEDAERAVRGTGKARRSSS